MAKQAGEQSNSGTSTAGQPPVVDTTAVDIDQVVAAAVAKALAGVKPQVQPPSQTIYVSGEKPKKPLYASQADVPQEFYTEETMRIVRNGNSRVFPHFIVKGQAIECPRTQIIRFRKFQDDTTVRFGAGDKTVYKEVYDTNDKREQDLFLADDRMGGDFYVDRGRKQTTSKHLLMTLFAKHKQILDATGTEAIRGMTKASGGDISQSMAEQRIALANQQAEVEFAQMQEQKNLKDVDEGKKALMTGRA